MTRERGQGLMIDDTILGVEGRSELCWNTWNGGQLLASVRDNVSPHPRRPDQVIGDPMVPMGR